MNILVVEEEKKIAGQIKRSLEEEDFTVALSNNGVDGLTEAMTGNYGLVILDLQIPKKDGLEVIKELREAGNMVPVLVLSSLNSAEDIVSGLDAGADDYMAKPLELVELAARARALIRRSSQDRGAEVVFADLRLDPVSHRIWRGGTEIDVTPQEYRMMEYFMRKPDQVLSRKEIAENCWDGEFDAFTNIIDVYVNYLRKKVDSDYPVKLIRTVRGQGYMLSAK